MAAYAAGQIVLVDWRDALPKEPNKRRPAIVIENCELFDADYPNVVLVPLTEDGSLVIPDLSVCIDPSPENGCSRPCYAVSPLVTATSCHRVQPTPSRVTQAELARIRRQVAEPIGLG